MSVIPAAVEQAHSSERLAYEGDLERFRDLEWLLNNSNGSFAMGSALGLNTRRYHGLLTAATMPPVGRILLLNSMIETLTIDPGGPDERAVEISNHQFADDTIHPQGHQFLREFVKDVSVRWVYQIEGVQISREVYLFDDRDLTAITYRVKSAGSPLRLRIRPLVSLRDFHSLQSPIDPQRYEIGCSIGRVQVRTDDCELVMGSEQGSFTKEPDCWHGFKYLRESERGLEDVEDLFCPGYFDFDCDSGESETLIIYAGGGSDLYHSIEESKKRRLAHQAIITKSIEPQISRQPALGQLAVASDQFVVQRRVDGDASTSILAGYPWFADWGRDTMICLPGLLLATGRHQEALQTLATFGRHVRRGLVPNRFDDYGGEPHYNTVDASLWYIHAAAQYLHLTGDWSAFAEHALPACRQIIEHYMQGTDFGIGMDDGDKLIYAGSTDTQLTWMDAKRDGVVFTPRHGKAVEINALWHHGLACLADVLREAHAEEAGRLGALADEVAASFRSAFWNDDAGCLHDCLVPDDGGWRAVSQIRPNQLFAVSLSNSPLRIAQQRAVVDICQEHLLTPMGMRTLSPSDPAYKPRFEGDMFARDAAYHQGTVWPWLIGPFVEASLRVEGFTKQACEQARLVIEPLLGEMDSQCLGQVAEVYDGGDPGERDLHQRPQACVAQAWSVAELLRVALLIERGPID